MSEVFCLQLHTFIPLLQTPNTQRHARTSTHSHTKNMLDVYFFKIQSLNFLAYMHTSHLHDQSINIRSVFLKTRKVQLSNNIKTRLLNAQSQHMIRFIRETKVLSNQREKCLNKLITAIQIQLNKTSFSV